MVEFAETAMRKMCRNPRCGCKLPAPVSNPREAFCTRGCHSSFYRKRCLICEEPMGRKTEHQLVCGKRKCRNALQASFDGGRYHVSSRTIDHLKTSIKPGIKSSLKSDRAPSWRVIAAGSPISANRYHCAIVGAEEATAAADRINAAHWKAAKAGERGFRSLGSPVVESSEASPAAAISAGRVASLVATIPDDLSIPAFLDRRPLPLQRAA
jgi:hypothetical protein